ncbi:DSBA oxidoreductase [Nocardiopsis terrae]|uniref:DsbA family dithiol-disulfide isomerase n=1 Tax=Nocardiopsis terrae TaxID=372655 RepID=A0ABR9HHF5_9ACTN|nr:DsbA family oxidoreductase [Nocardiopsis terrae]MBE1458461.1 putative DsbA family dithiol-disulfide isomerase [Nocardiopsis terrae]GHC80323.1 DSBA oxidoreductase [Nocardiopsis terrae]
MQVEVWSDIVCPWCYIGKRRLEKALAGFEHADEVELVWRSFQLDPAFPKGVREPVYDSLAKKMNATREQVREMTGQVKEVAAQEGLDYEFENAVMVNTFDAHRLTHLARERGLGGEAHERLMRAQLVEARVLDDVDTLVELAEEIGLDTGQARTVLTGDAYTAEVEDDIRTAQQLGATGVPFFVMDRAFGVSGAQPLEVFAAALEKAHTQQA